MIYDMAEVRESIHDKRHAKSENCKVKLRLQEQPVGSSIYGLT